MNLLTLLDDIATTFDDIAIMTKVAVKKTSVLMSDDLAVNADVIVGTSSERELPIVKSIFYGSLLNKVYAIAAVLALTYIYPPALRIVLFVGGLYLAFEGMHKVFDKFKNRKTKKKKLIVSEEAKIKGAVRTDLILSIEIILIAKRSIQGAFVNQLVALCLVGLAASIIIYGLIAILVKLDDFGLFLISKKKETIGLIFVKSMPYIMKSLGFIGTLAMLMVGGEIITHTFHITEYIPTVLQNILLAAIAGSSIVLILKLIPDKKQA